MPQGQSGYSHPLHYENGLNNEEEENGAVEQAPEHTLVYPQYEHVVLSPPTTAQDLLLQFPQAEVCSYVATYAQNSSLAEVVSI